MKCLRPLLVTLRLGGWDGGDENRDGALACEHAALQGDPNAWQRLRWAHHRAGLPVLTAPADELGVKSKGDTARKGHF